MLAAGFARAQAADPFAKFSNVKKTDAVSAPAAGRVPVILDTDINGDLDDTYAFVQVLKNPRFDVKLITTTSGNSVERARQIAKMLAIAGRTDIPIGLGGNENPRPGSQSDWVGNYNLKDYHGKVYEDGVKAMVDTVNKSPVPVTIIGIGPLQTISRALERDPGIASRANLAIMNGNIAATRDKATGVIIPEGNTRNAIPEAQRVYAAPWKSMIIAPLDTTDIWLGKRERPIFDAAAGDPLLEALIGCREAFVAKFHPDGKGWKPNGEPGFTQRIFDCSAVYLADPDPSIRKWVNVQKMKIKVTDEGRTVVDPQGHEILVALTWNDRDATADYIVKTLTSPTVKP